MRRAGMAVWVVAGAGLLLAGCTGNGNGNGGAAWPGAGTTAATARTAADEALAALVRGDVAQAEARSRAALAANPREPVALLVAATVYENTARPSLARPLYKEVVALPEPALVSGGLWGRSGPTTAQEVAAEGLRRLGEGAPSPAATTAMPAASPAQATAVLPPSATSRYAAPEMSPETRPEAQRFLVLKRLLDDALITPQEYAARRGTNLGAVLPLTQPAPAVGLDRPAPGEEEVVDRLHQLRQAYETRNISAGQHEAEREVILDSLLPATANPRANPPPPPRDVVEVAAAIGRLERLRELNVISQGEAAKEKAALGRLLAGGAPSGVAAAPLPPPSGGADKPKPPPAASSSQSKAPAKPATPAKAETKPDAKPAEAAKPKPSGDAAILNPAAVLRTGRDVTPGAPAPAGTAPPVAITPDPPAEGAAPDTPASGGGRTVAAVHLASFRSEAEAMKAWEQLKAKHGGTLAGLQPYVSTLVIPNQGTFYRLHAGPLPGSGAAKTLCESLKEQFCKPVDLGG